MCKKVFLFAILFLILLPVPTRAERALSFGLWTHHYTGKHNEGIENRLVCLEVDRWTFAYFSNSYNNDTVFGGYAFHTKKIFSPQNKNLWVRANAYAGILYGYGEDIPTNIKWLGNISPAVYPTGSIGWKNYSIELGVMPTFIWWALKVEF